MPKKVDEVNQRILEMLEEKRNRRRGNLEDLPLVDKILDENKKILRKNGSKLPKLPKPPKV